MFRILFGVLCVLGAVGSQDYALEAGIVPPSLTVMIIQSIIGFVLILWGMQKYTKDDA